MQLRHAARTDVGKTRDHNEDTYGVEVGGERAAAGALFVLCDGMGGFASGEVASDLAVKTIVARYYETENGEPDRALVNAFLAANETVFHQGGGKMGTTSVAALFRDDVVIIANVGDCRAYLIRDSHPRQLTRDHSFVAEQVAAGILTEAQARDSSYRHIITRAIGHRPELEVDTFREPLLQDDVVVLCSDGLHGLVSADEIALAVSKVALDDACRALIKLANDRGGPDNITVVAVRVVALSFASETPPAKANASVAKTARLDATATPAGEARGGTARMETSGGTPRTEPGYGPAPLIDRRKGDRRTTPPAPAAPPAAPSRGPLRSFLLWAALLLLLAVLLFGGYYYFLFLQGATPTASPSVAPRPALTPLGASAPATVPTLVPTDPAATPSP